MKVKIYCVTYNNNEILNNWFLESVYNSSYPKDKVEISIINNHSNFEIYEKYNGLTKVIHNNLRPDFSTGHLSRNWNEAIINGFKDLDEPDCDMVVAIQNDTILMKDWYEKLISLAGKYEFVSQGAGDQIQVFTPKGVKTVGLYDERFCGIGYQEADYFLRCVIYLNEKCSINDDYHGRVNNPLEIDIIEKIDKAPPGALRTEEYVKHHFEKYGWIAEGKKLHNEEQHPICGMVFHNKWGFPSQGAGSAWDKRGSEGFDIESVRQNIDNYFFYPYFEKKMNYESLISQRYLCSFHMGKCL
jgi:hypothetical protein